MEIIAKGVGEGKTNELISMCITYGYTLVVATREEIKAISDNVEMHTEQVIKIITYKQFLEKSCELHGHIGYVIDQIEHLFEQHTRIPVHAVTITTREDS